MAAFTADQLAGNAELTAKLFKAAGLIVLLEAESAGDDAVVINLDELNANTPVEQLAAALELLK